MHQINSTSQKLVSKKQEAVRVGHVVVLSECDHLALCQYKQRFLARGYQVDETAHFVVCQKPSSHDVVLLYTFGQAEVDADLICFIEQELTPFEFIHSAKDFGAVLFAVLASTFPAPRNQQHIWRLFCVNTLNKLHEQMVHPPTRLPPVSYITPFAAIYRRVIELYAGQSLLDVGCSFGFLPVLLARHAPNIHIVGCDNSPDAIRFSTDLAATTGVHQITFKLEDILNPSILGLGIFDTVTALHVLEHVAEHEMAVALAHLLQMTSKRLIIAVPYEEQVQRLYGHQQIFTQEKLHTWGRLCIHMLQGIGQYWCEDVMGGMLIIERSS